MITRSTPVLLHRERATTVSHDAVAKVKSAGRSLASYLLVPRPKDLVKCVVAPLGFVVGLAAQPAAATDNLGRAVVVWLALELLVYQARYQWNDIRGFAADQAHPDAAKRGRLPGPLERARPHIAASLAVMAARLGLTAMIAVVVPDVAAVVLAMTVGVFGAAIVYERVRSAATGRTTTVPVPLRPPLIALWIVVGAGYAVRGMVGLALAVDVSDRPGLVAASAAAMWTLGIVFVTCRWALEALCLATVANGRLVWRLRPEQAREHTVGLVRWLPDDASDAEPDGPCAWRALHGRTSPVAPWNVALVASAGAAALTGALLVGDGAEVATAVLATVVGAIGALAVVLLPTQRVPVAIVACAALAVVHAAMATPRPLAAALPLGVVLGAYTLFCEQCADDVGDTFRRLRPLLHG